MELHHLRCFVAAAEELHFGRAAQRLGMLPAAFGRFIRLLERDLGTELFERTTRTVKLTGDGAHLLAEAQRLLAGADALRSRFREQARTRTRTLRIGAIDSAAAGLVPALLHDFGAAYPAVAVELLEDKTVRLLPKLLSGRLDAAIVRPPKEPHPNLVLRDLFAETAVVAMASAHPLASHPYVTPQDLADEPLIVPDRRSRPHSHDLAIKIVQETGHRPTVARTASEKQTIVHMVSAGLGLAVVPRWTSRMKVDGVAYVALHQSAEAASRLPLAAAWLGGARDDLRDALLGVLFANLGRYSADA